MLVWAYMRHYLNLKILWSVLTEFTTVGPYELNWETQQYKCWIAQYICFALLASLQAVNMFWFFLICRIAYRFIVYKDADDDRSEYEPTDEELEGREEAEEAKEQLKEAKEDLNGTANGAQGVLSLEEDGKAYEGLSKGYENASIGSGVKQRIGVATS
jgi:acyl-CoA-dependent ceramide synthase